MTQEQVAACLRLGRPYIALIETGREKASPSRTRQLCDLYGRPDAFDAVMRPQEFGEAWAEVARYTELLSAYCRAVAQDAREAEARAAA